MSETHPTAVVHPKAQLGVRVRIGPYAVVEEGVEVGDDSQLGPHAVLHAGTRIGRGVQVGPHVVLGGDPQDLGFDGATSSVVVGDRSVVREFATVHRSAREGGTTRVGADCMLMTLTHVGHDCTLADGVVLTSYAGLSGHVSLGERVVVGGGALFHQRVSVGRLAMVSGLSRVVKDVPPFVIAEGNPCRIRGLNVIGMRRADLPAEARDTVKRAFRLLYRRGLNVGQAVEAIRREIAGSAEVDDLLAFVEASGRGLTRGSERGVAAD